MGITPVRTGSVVTVVPGPPGPPGLPGPPGPVAFDLWSSGTRSKPTTATTTSQASQRRFGGDVGAGAVATVGSFS